MAFLEGFFSSASVSLSNCISPWKYLLMFPWKKGSNQSNLLKLGNVRSGCQISRAEGSCIKRASIPEPKARVSNVQAFRMELEFPSVGFYKRRKPEYPEKNFSGQRKEATTNSTHMVTQSPENKPRVTMVGGECSQHYTIPALHKSESRIHAIMSFLLPFFWNAKYSNNPDVQGMAGEGCHTGSTSHCSNPYPGARLLCHHAHCVLHSRVFANYEVCVLLNWFLDCWESYFALVRIYIFAPFFSRRN